MLPRADDRCYRCPPRAVRRSSEHELIDQLLVVEQVDPAGVQQRQEIAVEVGLGPLARLVGDAVRGEALAPATPGVAVAGDAG